MTHKKVYCKECKFLQATRSPFNNLCRSNPIVKSNYLHRYPEYSSCWGKNSNNDCKEFVPKRGLFKIISSFFHGILSTASNNPEKYMEGKDTD